MTTSGFLRSEGLLNPPDVQVKTARERVLNGSIVMLTGLGLVTAINFAYNIAVARFLGPTSYGHVTSVYTVMILLSAVTLSFQILTAKMVAQQETIERKGIVYRTLHRRALATGIAIGATVVLFRGAITNYLNLPSSTLIVLLGIGVAFYVPLGARRGYMQGTCSFGSWALNLVLEGLVRFGGSVLAIVFGLGVTGVIAAIASGVATAYFVATPRLASVSEQALAVPIAFREGLQAIVFFAGQVIINNCDIVVVKHFFAPELAGMYAAVAMVGRVIFAFSWAVVSSMFPIAAGSRSGQRQDDGVLPTSLVLVFGIGTAMTAGLWVAPSGLWTLMFGARFGVAGHEHFSHLLVLYAIATSVYVFSVVLIAYEMSNKIANTGWVQLLFSVLVVGGIYAFHGSLAQVIWVQIVLMALLLLSVTIPFLMDSRVKVGRLPKTGLDRPIRVIRPVSEHEVIAEFLKNDFKQPQFQRYQALEPLLTNPSYDDQGENTLRRMLLFMRHGSLWRELPKGTSWYEVEVGYADMERIRVFPRAHWRRLARGNFAATEVAKCIADGTSRDLADDDFFLKLAELRGMVREEKACGAVLLIGETEHGPFTILDGNHRFVAAMLEDSTGVGRYRFFCGLSPRMALCCWYETNVVTLARYGTNLLRYFTYDPEAEVGRLLQRS